MSRLSRQKQSYFEPRWHLLHEEETVVMTKCEDCRYAAVDEGASCSYDGGGSNRDGSKWWTAYMCNNAASGRSYMGRL